MGDKSAKPSQKSVKAPSRRQSERSCFVRYRSTNSFVNYLTELIRTPENSGSSTKRLFKVAGVRWGQMTPEEKLPYIEAAEYHQRQKATERAKRGPIEKKKHRLNAKCSACGHIHGKPENKGRGKPPAKGRAGTRRGAPVTRATRRNRKVKVEPKTGYSSRRTSFGGSDVFDSDTMMSSVSSF